MRKIKLGLIQFHCKDRLKLNMDQAIIEIKEAAAQGAQIICLPELFCSHYFCHIESHENFQLAETIPGPSTEILSQLASQLNIVLIASLFEKRAGGLYHNTAVVINADGKFLGKYRKMHIPDDPGYYEKFYFTPGDLGYQVFDTLFGKIGVLICWDQWYPEAARITSLKGAEILFYPTAIGWAIDQDLETNQAQYHAWQLIQCSHAIANGVHVASVNRVGREGNMQFWGGSFIANPFGTILFQAQYEHPQVIVQEIDLDQTDFYRTHWPFLRDRRVDSYQSLTQRYIDHEHT